MKNIHDYAREILSGDGKKLDNSQKKAIFLFADWLLQKRNSTEKRKRIRRIINTEDGQNETKIDR